MIRPDRWQLAVWDAGRFLQEWGAQAAALGWGTLDVFGCHPTHPVERPDCMGLVLLLHGDSVAALTADTACIRTRSGACLTYYRRPRPGAVPLWRLARPSVDRMFAEIVRETRWLFPGAIINVREVSR